MPGERPLIRVIRKLLPFTAAGAALAVLYAVWVLSVRWDENRRLERAAESRKAEAVPGIPSDGKLKILSFYVTPPAIKRGENALVCYGVVNASAVRLDPPVERVYPALNRCFEVTPRRTTHYTLTAEDGKGRQAAAAFVLQVK